MMISARLLSLVLFTFSFVLPAQEYPQDFINPLKLSRQYVGNFGELRRNHFHAGVDMRTNSREGYNLYAAQEGYVARIKVSSRGYGNALYIAHPNGYTTVYAHMSKFSSKIEKYTRDHLYKYKQNEKDIYPKPGEVTVSQGEIIGLSGNSGGSGGPHLHFEIRDTKTEEPINPFFFGFDVPDTKSPLINGLYLYAKSGDVQGKQGRYKLSGTTYLKASGLVGVGVKTYDQHNGLNNLNGIHSIEVISNGSSIFEYIADRFSYSYTRQMNSLIDYDAYLNYGSWIYQCYKDPGNKLQMIKSTNENGGLIDVKPGETYKIQIIVKDYKGNTAKRNITLVGTQNGRFKETYANELRFDKENEFTREGVHITFPKGVFTENIDFSYRETETSYYIHKDEEPAFKHFTLALAPKGISPVDYPKTLLTRHYKKKGAWKKDYEGGEYKNGKIVAKVRDFGIYKFEVDKTKPAFSALSGSSVKSSLRYKMYDTQSGIKDYNVYIDGKWTLAYYDAKYKTLKINLNKEGVSSGYHTIKIVVSDRKNNIRTYNSSFTKL